MFLAEHHFLALKAAKYLIFVILVFISIDLVVDFIEMYVEGDEEYEKEDSKHESNHLRDFAWMALAYLIL